MTLPQETVKRIEEESENCLNEIDFRYEGFHDMERNRLTIEKYLAAEAQRAMIVEAEKDKLKWEQIRDLENAVNRNHDKIQQLTTERDAYKKGLLEIRKRYEKSEWIVAIIDEVLQKFTDK